MKPSDCKIVEVEWVDAQSSMDTFDDQELERLEPITTHSVGYLLKETADYIVLGFTLFGNELTKHHQVIPRRMLKGVRTIKEG